LIFECLLTNSYMIYKKSFEEVYLLIFMNSIVRISELSLYLRCPRLVYFDSMGRSIWEGCERPFNLLLRELALSLSDLKGEIESKTKLEFETTTDANIDLEIWLRKELSRAGAEFPVIYGKQIDYQDLAHSMKELGGIIPQMAKGLVSKLDLILPSDVEVELRSSRLKLSGILDRLVYKEPLMPSVIRTGSPPKRGIWRDDRIRLTGYALLLEEKFDQNLTRGLVEYPLEGEIREAEIRLVDRRRTLRIRDRILQIKGGRLPDRPKDAPCNRCPLEGECQIRRSLASKFF